MDKFEKFLNGCNCMTVKPVFLSGYSFTGEKPSSSHKAFDAFEEARQYTIDALADLENEFLSLPELYGKKLLSQLRKAIKVANLSSYVFTTEPVNGYSFWVMENDSVEPEFSYQGCDCCNDGLGNNVYEVEGYNPESEEVQYLGKVCEDCLYEFNYGESR